MKDLKELLFEWNPWWEKSHEFRGVKRELLSTILKWVGRKEIIAVVGARRSGKTTLLFEIIDFLIKEKKVKRENILFIKADDERAEKQHLIDSAIDEYLKWKNPEGRVFVFIDEVQEIKDWQKTLKRIYDLEQEKKKIFISGSNASLLKEELGHLLTGRVAYFELFTFSFREFLAANRIEVKNETGMMKQRNAIRRALAEYVSFGGFPEVVLEKNNERKESLLRFYFDSILFRDVMKRKKIRAVEKMTRLVEMCLQNTSSYANFTKMGKLLEMTPDSIKEYTQYLEEAYLVFAINIFAYSLKKQFINPKKIYCIDPGMRRIVGFVFSRDAGRIYENLVFLELKRKRKKLYYYKNKYECDFLVKENTSIKEAIQVCYELGENREREIQGLVEAIKKFKLARGIIVTEDYTGVERRNGKEIKFIPLWKWLLTQEL